jgi:uncharacterized membrane protein HdeD (DUF308 family)
MLAMMRRNWWLPALRGIAAIVLGLAAWLSPDQSLTPLIVLFGIFALIDGALNVAVAILLAQDDTFRWLPLGIGVVGALLGIVIIAGRDIAEIGLTYVIAIFLIVIGGFNILTAIALIGEFPGAWLFAFMGMISVLFGVAIGVAPDLESRTLAGLIGTFAALYGILALILAFRLRAAHDQTATSSANADA